MQRHTPAPSPPSLAQRYALVRQRIDTACQRAQRDPASVRLLAVSKGQPHSAVQQLFELGQCCFGESYLQEALEKRQRFDSPAIEWHYIGHIQSNKSADIAHHFDWVHSVDRFKIAQRLSVQRPPEMAPLNICLQINVDEEATKHGVRVDDALALARRISELPNLQLRGLMALPKPTTDFEQQRHAFARLRQLAETLQCAGLALDTLSMGMSDDLEAAIAENSHIVRVGSALFGPRGSKVASQ